MNQTSKTIIALVAGAAIGAGIAYLLLNEDSDEMIEKIKQKASKLKDDLDEKISQGREMAGKIKDDIDEMLHKENA